MVDRDVILSALDSAHRAAVSRFELVLGDMRLMQPGSAPNLDQPLPSANNTFHSIGVTGTSSGYRKTSDRNACKNRCAKLAEAPSHRPVLNIKAIAFQKSCRKLGLSNNAEGRFAMSAIQTIIDQGKLGVALAVTGKALKASMAQVYRKSEKLTDIIALSQNDTVVLLGALMMAADGLRSEAGVAEARKRGTEMLNDLVTDLPERKLERNEAVLVAVCGKPAKGLMGKIGSFKLLASESERNVAIYQGEGRIKELTKAARGSGATVMRYKEPEPAAPTEDLAGPEDTISSVTDLAERSAVYGQASANQHVRSDDGVDEAAAIVPPRAPRFPRRPYESYASLPQEARESVAWQARSLAEADRSTDIPGRAMSSSEEG